MARIVIELTNRCNLSCTHCFDGRHSADGSIKLEIIEKALHGAKALGFNHISFTGGEPTVHPRFIEILRMVFEAEYDYSFVTNGQNFTKIYGRVLPYRRRLTGITFSLDGAEEKTHDRLRGKGSYRRVMKAVSICVVKDIPFTLNMVITSHNRGELEEMAELATKLGSRGLRFGHLLPTPLTTLHNLDLSPEDRREVEAVIWHLQKNFPIPVIMAPGYYTMNLFPCAPLQMQECNIDWRGNLTKCCHLSGHGNGVGNDDVLGNLEEISFFEAYERLVEENGKLHQKKLNYQSSGSFKDSDYFPCWYCENYFKKVNWLQKFPKSPWSGEVWANLNKDGDVVSSQKFGRIINDRAKSEGKT